MSYGRSFVFLGKHVRDKNTTLNPHVYIVKMGLAGVYLFWLIIYPKHIVGTRLNRLEAVLTTGA